MLNRKVILKSCSLAIGISIISVSMQAMSGTVCLYEHSNYKGWKKCYSTNKSNFVSLGINDKVSSIKVSPGTKAELYQHINYRGYKRVYTKNTPWVGNQVNDQYSSLKISNPKVCLYQHANYKGWEKCFNTNQSNFVPLGMNDQVSSIKVSPGNKAVLYQHINYNGYQRVYTANTPWVGNQVNDQYSSLKINPKKIVCLYQHANYKGWKKCYSTDKSNFVSLGINDQVSSVKVSSGAKAELYQHINYRGYKRVYTRNTPWIGNQVNDQYSSLRVR